MCPALTSLVSAKYPDIEEVLDTLMEMKKHYRMVPGVRSPCTQLHSERFDKYFDRDALTSRRRISRYFENFAPGLGAFESW